MLVLSRKPSEKIIIDVYGEIIEIIIIDCKVTSARIGVTCSKEIQVDREEIYKSKEIDKLKKLDKDIKMALKKDDYSAE